MSRGDYYEKKEAAVRIGHALERRGWKLYGWKEDRSDSMTDYFDPESWDGVAQKGDFVACVNVSPYTVESRSGCPESRTIPVPGGECPRCSGSKVDPLGWTLGEAKENPALFNTDTLRAEHLDARERAAVASPSIPLPSGGEIRWVLPVVSPLLFNDAGLLKCRMCHGVGHGWEEPRVEVLFTWPTFQANPKGRTWHVERGGEILLAGAGLNRCYSVNHGRHEAEAAAERIAAQIDQAKRSPSPALPTTAYVEPGDAPGLSENPKLNGLELRFAVKPAEPIRQEMKTHGWRWTRFGGCWYHRNTPENRAFAEALIARLTVAA